jgi:hypothetical protein
VAADLTPRSGARYKGTGNEDFKGVWGDARSEADDPNPTHHGVMSIGRRFALTALASAAALLMAAGPAAADGPTVTFDHGYTDSESLVYLASQSVTAHIQDPSAADQVQCDVDEDTPPGPCGTQDPSCPVAQCWTYTFTGAADGYNHDLEVDAGPANAGSLRYDHYFFISLTAPGDPVLHTPPPPAGNAAQTRRPSFDFAPSEGEEDAPLRDTECAATPLGSTTVHWVKCTGNDPLPMSLSLTGSYRFQVRVVDVFGRIDAHPPSYVFSPTPCRPQLVGRPRSLSSYRAGGIRVRVHCVQRVGAGSFVDMSTSEREAERLALPGPILASARVRTTHTNQTVVVTLQGLKQVPAYVFGIHGLRADLVAVQRESYGWQGVQRNVVR